MLKTRLITPLAVACTAFMWGCQEQASSPVEPEGSGILLDKVGPHPHGGGGEGGDNPGSETYSYTITGDITTDPPTADAQPTVGNDQGGQVVLQGCCQNDETLKLSAALLASFDDDADDATACFGESFSTDEFIGELIPGKKVADRIVAIFYFTARDKLDNHDVRYKLRLDGGDPNVDGPGIFSPEPGQTMTVTFTDFSIDAERKKEKNACSGTGELPGVVNTSVKVEGIS